MNENFTQFAFTPSVKAQQERYGSRGSYARMEESGDRYLLTDVEKEFIATRDGFYLSSVGENGWPYMQFRGGPPGFLRVVGERTLAYADFRGNRQYISTGNLTANARASLFLMDYPTRQRLKIWAEVEIFHGDEAPEDLVRKVDLGDYKAAVERIVVFTIRAYDWNCPQHITPRYTLEEIAQGVRQGNPELLQIMEMLQEG